MTCESAADPDARARRLRTLSPAVLAYDKAFLKVFDVPAPILARLQGAAAAYVWNTLASMHPAEKFVLTLDVLERYRDSILGLPNRTANGVLLVRNDTQGTFNTLHRYLADLMTALGLSEAFSKIQVPCNVRIVAGSRDAAGDSRNYASTKIHTDLWNGEPLAAMLINLPLLGDPSAVAIRFYEPAEFPEDLMGPLGDYVLGERMCRAARPYDVPFERGKLYLSDPFCLHQTFKAADGIRLSLDFRAIAADRLDGESDGPERSKATYIPAQDWYRIGSEILLSNGNPFDLYEKRRQGTSVVEKPVAVMKVDEPR